VVRYNAVEDLLDEFEQLMFDSRAGEALPNGDLDFAHYRALHRHFFQDVYDWAGETRTIRTGKGDNWFCYPEYIQSEADRLFAELAERGYLAVAEGKDAFAQEAA
jgi:cell filamentation protein